MPLHVWTNDQMWENFHTFWVVRLADAIQPLLPVGYQVYLGSYSQAGLAAAARPDLGVTSEEQVRLPDDGGGIHTTQGEFAPDDEVALATVDPQRTVYVQYRGLIVAAIELVSPANKDRPSRRFESAARYAGYLHGGINLMLVDVLPRPYEFSFVEAIERDIGLTNQTPLPAPCAAVYRVGGRAVNGGSYVAFWRRSLAIGQPLPTLPLPLSVHSEVMVDLDATYMRAAVSAYLP